MSAEFDEHLERMISRKLDGELSDEESLALDKLLIRSPEARRLLEEISALDQAAATEVRRACSGPHAVPAPGPVSARPRASRWARCGPPMAAAACVLLWLGWSILSQAPAISRHPIDVRRSRPTPALSPISAAADGLVPSYRLGRHVQLYGVYDDDQSKLYLLEVQQTEQESDDPHGVQPAFGQPLRSDPM